MPPTREARNNIVVRGARTHNLKNVDLTIPQRALVVMTGVSGSGKSSLAFDTIYAEGQRRYVESLSAYARQFLERMEKPDVDAIEGISPAIAIRQKNSIRNPRSTVSTTTEIHDYLRLLFARVGRTICRNCGREVVRETAEVVSAQLGTRPAGTRLLIGFDMPVVATAGLPSLEGAGGPRRARSCFRRITMTRVATTTTRASRTFRASWTRWPRRLPPCDAKDSGVCTSTDRRVSLEEVDPAALKDRPMLQVIVDRVKVDGDLRARLTDSIETAYTEGGGAAFAIELTDSRRRPGQAPRRELSTASASASSAAAARSSTEVPQPRLFSFNNPFGACGVCHGFGNIIELDMDLVVPDAIEVDSPERDRAVEQAALSRAPRRAEARGEGREPSPGRALVGADRRGEAVRRRGRRRRVRRRQGLLPLARAQEVQGARPRVPEPLPRISDLPRVPRRAAAARGARRPGRRPDDRSGLRADRARRRSVLRASSTLSEKDAAVADKVMKEIRKRLGFLRDVGLDYLTLDRLSSTLSGGESQRINLATSLGSALVDTLYVLDEPSIGLHSRDNERLIAILRQLRDQGNTVLVVEHDADMIRVADTVVDMGLGAGEQGGRVVFSGHARGADAGAAVADGQVPARRAGDSGAGGAAQADEPEAQGARRERAQPQEHRRRDPARRC